MYVLHLLANLIWFVTSCCWVEEWTSYNDPKPQFICADTYEEPLDLSNSKQLDENDELSWDDRNL